MIYRFFENLAKWTTEWAGSTIAFVTAVIVIITWVLCGPYFNYSDTWQLVINTSTTIVTFLMVFLIQRATNRDCISMQIKLNEILSKIEKTNKKLINIEHMTEEEINQTYKLYNKIDEIKD